VLRGAGEKSHCAVIHYAGIYERAVGQLAVLPRWPLYGDNIVKQFALLCMLISLMGCQSALLKVNYVKYRESYPSFPTDPYRLQDQHKTLLPLVPGYAEKLAQKKSVVSILPRPHEDTSDIEIEFLHGNKLTIFLPSKLLLKANDEELKDYLHESGDKKYILLFKNILKINKVEIGEQ
jgi:hypothetical protein